MRQEAQRKMVTECSRRERRACDRCGPPVTSAASWEERLVVRSGEAHDGKAALRECAGRRTGSRKTTKEIERLGREGRSELGCARGGGGEVRRSHRPNSEHAISQLRQRVYFSPREISAGVRQTFRHARGLYKRGRTFHRRRNRRGLVSAYVCGACRQAVWG